MQTPVAKAGGVRQGWLTAEQLARPAADGSWDLAPVRNPEVAILNDGKDWRRAGCHQRALTCLNRASSHQAMAVTTSIRSAEHLKHVQSEALTLN